MGESTTVRDWVIGSVFGAEKGVAEELIGCVSPLVPDPARLEEMRTAVTEACLNAMEHGNGMLASKQVRITLRFANEYAVIRVYDDGPGFAYALGSGQAREGDSRGWGLLFMERFADWIETGWEQGVFYAEMQFWLGGERRG